MSTIVVAVVCINPVEHPTPAAGERGRVFFDAASHVRSRAARIRRAERAQQPRRDAASVDELGDELGRTVSERSRRRPMARLLPRLRASREARRQGGDRARGRQVLRRALVLLPRDRLSHRALGATTTPVEPAQWLRALLNRRAEHRCEPSSRACPFADTQRVYSLGALSATARAASMPTTSSLGLWGA